MDSICWLVIFLVLLLIEIFTLGLTTIWFAGGAIVAFISTLCDANITVQIILFVVVSVILLIVTRPIALKYLTKNTLKTNVEEIIGKNAIISKEILDGNNNGEAKLNGEIWMARSQNGEQIKEGETVEIVAVEGVKLIVKRCLSS